MKRERITIDQRYTPGARRIVQRDGLAPLELVMALPLLLCVMALIVNFGHAATWKIRAATSSRLAMWRHRPMWNADNDPKPVNFWPPGSSLGVSGGSRVSQVDPIWNQPAIAQPWIKGPVFTAGQGYLVVRDNRVNEMAEGVSKGTGDVSLLYPFLPSMGKLSMHAEHSLLDNVWQFHTMGYGWNEARRAKGWWQLEDSADWATEKQDFLIADAKIQNYPQRELMRPLDRDEDLIRRGYPFDFYTKLSPIEDNDPVRVHDAIVAPNGLLDRIRGTNGNDGVCKRMAKGYLQMYMDELALLQMNPAGFAGRIAQLQMWIQQLNDFIAKLP